MHSKNFHLLGTLRIISRDLQREDALLDFVIIKLWVNDLRSSIMHTKVSCTPLQLTFGIILHLITAISKNNM